MLQHAVEASYTPPVVAASVGWMRLFHLISLSVPAFFVISGFCIHVAHVQSGETGYVGYALRRFFRIYPPYLLILGIYAVGHDYSAPQILSHLALLHNFRFRWLFGINASFWSLAVESQLYVLYPLVVFVAARWRWRWTLAILALFEGAILVADHLQGGLPTLLRFNVLGFGFSWTVGAALGHAWLHRHDAALPFSSVWHRIVWTTLFVIPPWFTPLGAVFLFPIGALTVVSWMSWALGRDWSAPMKTAPARILTLVGVSSYSLFLVHQPLLLAASIDGIDRRLDLAWLIALFVPIAVLGLGLRRLLEEPSTWLGKQVRTLLLRGSPSASVAH